MRRNKCQQNPRSKDALWRWPVRAPKRYSVKTGIYSSWPLTNEKDLHSHHLGKLKSTLGAKVFTLDEFVEASGINSIDFIKIDVDGNEADIISGALKIIKKYRPILLVEWAPELFINNGNLMEKILYDLFDLGYTPRDLQTGSSYPKNIHELNKLVPKKSSINILFNCLKKHSPIY
mgnify:CR=1 FL=1